VPVLPQIPYWGSKLGILRHACAALSGRFAAYALIWYAFPHTSVERCPSGLRSTLGKRVLGKLNRGFKSHPLRHQVCDVFSVSLVGPECYSLHSNELERGTVAAPPHGNGPSLAESQVLESRLPRVWKKRTRTAEWTKLRSNMTCSYSGNAEGSAAPGTHTAR
jgi:hypothetical protein